MLNYPMSYNPFEYKTTTPQAAYKDAATLAIDVIQGLVLAAAVIVLIYLFFIIPTQVDGLSMDPTFKDNQIMLTNRFIQLVGGPDGLIKNYNYQRGQVVVYKRPGRSDLIKRIIGLPGEKVMVKDKSVWINGIKLTEPYIDKNLKPTNPGSFIAEGQEIVIPENHYFTLGDNRINSIDSRDSSVGFVHRNQLRGQVFLSITVNMGFIQVPQYPELAVK
jgi:signal peptidase I